MAKDKKEPIVVIAELEVCYGGETEKIKTFDKAWHRMLEVSRHHVPVSSHFVRFGRID